MLATFTYFSLTLRADNTAPNDRRQEIERKLANQATLFIGNMVTHNRPKIVKGNALTGLDRI